MASRTSLYSFQNNIIEISINIDAIGVLHKPNTPLSTEERIEFSLCIGDNPWRHLGVPDSAICKQPTSGKEKHDDLDRDLDRVQEEITTDNEKSSEGEGRKRTLSDASICTEEMLMEMEELSKDWADENSLSLGGMFDLLEPPRIKISSAQLKIQKTQEIRKDTNEMSVDSNINVKRVDSKNSKMTVDSNINAMSVV
mmetsp:Transcript_26/g.32  ORF Transcript_26/g.32 Transcript_26/m.32 type:complete len:197 (-) Transcript_26:433-1023(-)|eukprot:CAMPEP_0119047058 /NCGR_PEP_ID=MMETSP1177-20130426/50746_1 /TAXON_ID=2985 /ORGANISM="Ochromonas sp, Strain CCMP1899" /LENGTH=196 /DNA_ID=CAMNT_0007021077 /DNA_START=54 /DNA_END=644 /DNA_ORIENTATION=-